MPYSFNYTVIPNSQTTATADDTASTIVLRDASKTFNVTQINMNNLHLIDEDTYEASVTNKRDTNFNIASPISRLFLSDLNGFGCFPMIKLVWNGSTYDLSGYTNQMPLMYDYANNQLVTCTDPSFSTITVSGNSTFSGLTASSLVATDSNKRLTSSVSSLSPQFTGLNLSGLTASKILCTDGSKNISSDPSTLSPTFQGLTLSGTGDVSLNITADTDNSGEDDVALINLSGDNGTTTMVIGQAGSGSSLSGITSNAFYFNCSGSESAGSLFWYIDSAKMMFLSSSGFRLYEGVRLRVVDAGGNTRQSGSATFVNGTVTITQTNIQSTARLYFTRHTKNASTAYGDIMCGTITVNTSFVVNSVKADTTTETGDQSSFWWQIIDCPAS